jgi:hypothetical protein
MKWCYFIPQIYTEAAVLLITNDLRFNVFSLGTVLCITQC